MPSLDNGYKHWDGETTSVWQRRWAIASTGLKLCLQGKLLRAVLAVTWSSTLAFMGIIFFVGQLTSPDSTLIRFMAETMGNRAGGEFLKLANGLASWVVLYPEICVDGVYRFIFFAATKVYSVASFIAISLFVAKLLAHDLASQAIVIYQSKALTRYDYLVGKFGIVFIILSMIWLMPIMSLWLFGNLMSPDWSFFIHSFKALTRALSTAGVAIVSFSLIAMAISAFARKTSAAVTLWIVVWVVSDMVGSAAQVVHPIGGYISFSHCLAEFSWTCYRLDTVWANATSMLPFFNTVFQQVPDDMHESLRVGSSGAFLPLGFISAFSLLSCFILKLRITSE